VVDLAKPGSDWKCVERAAEGHHLAMHFERWGEVADPGCETMLVEVAEGHLAMHFWVT